MNNEPGIIVLFGAALLVAVVVVSVWAAITLRYRITDKAVEVLVFGRCVRRVRLDDIAHVRRGHCFWNEHWTTFKFWNAVTLRRKSGLVKNFVITPDNPARFIAELTRKLEEHHG
ncbi:MAG: hypothetical protein N2689_06290 [Verrucomicrobiae bacterium]|nr:hypothetical protein [Verrucomicrobiae bacterium]